MNFVKTCPNCNKKIDLDLGVKSIFSPDVFCPMCEAKSKLNVKFKYYLLFYSFSVGLAFVVYYPLGFYSNFKGFLIVALLLIAISPHAYLYFSDLSKIKSKS